ncbi:hypothetical protein DERP_006795 [Dermatophagoides pteronyssinus]|uniref:Uncharacterized protein n=1 Tax=Dermatophagoides pteronyssinus TaxID=6956 RepID=A0ABQ8IS43_DERPT|nr:hypothetical protein DERP_006795 [Dermatophagoides pteronyssinus]
MNEVQPYDVVKPSQLTGSEKTEQEPNAAAVQRDTNV